MSCENIKLKEQKQYAKLDEILLQKLQTGIISSINKNIPILHNSIIYKIINYGINTKYITCSADKRIIVGII